MRLKQWLARALLALIGLVVLYQLWIFLHICWWVNHNPANSAFIEVGHDGVNELKIVVEHVEPQNPITLLHSQYDQWRLIHPCPVTAAVAGAADASGGGTKGNPAFPANKPPTGAAGWPGAQLARNQIRKPSRTPSMAREKPLSQPTSPPNSTERERSPKPKAA